MAKERTITPQSFHGISTEDGNAWSRQFMLYDGYRDLKDDKPLQPFKVLMKCSAGQRLDVLAADRTDTLEYSEAAFTSQHQTPETMKYKSARNIFHVAKRRMNQSMTSSAQW